jgi:hypothetical protein
MTTSGLEAELANIESERLAVLRYRSVIDIAVRGHEAGLLECWHLERYRRDEGDGSWRVRWSQATAIRGPDREGST